MNGKGIFIWKGRQCLDGSIEGIVADCVAMGLKWVALKMGDATNIAYASFPAEMPRAVAAFKAAGLKVWGWHYVYGGVWIDKAGAVHVEGASPAQEAGFARQQVLGLGLDGYLIDAEREWKVYSQAARASAFMQGLGDLGVPVGLCSYRFPSLHGEFPWIQFLGGCDLHAPQVYHGPGRGIIDLERSWNELKALRDLPVAPVGRAYIGDGYGAPGPSGEEVIQFLGHAKQKGCTGVSFWAMDFLTMHEGGAARREAIQGFVWGGELPPGVPVALGKIRVTANILNVRAGPGIPFADMGDLRWGTKWFVFEEAGDWVRIGEGVWVKTGTYLAEWVLRW